MRSTVKRLLFTILLILFWVTGAWADCVETVKASIIGYYGSTCKGGNFFSVDTGCNGTLAKVICYDLERAAQLKPAEAGRE